MLQSRVRYSVPFVSIASTILLVTVGTVYGVPIAATDFLPSARVITFENIVFPDFPDGTMPGTGPGGFGCAISGMFIGSEFGNRICSNLVNGSTPPRLFTDIQINFYSPQSAVGAWVGRITNFLNDPAEVMQLRVYSSDDVLLETLNVSLPATLNVPVFAGIYRPEGISRIEWLCFDTGFFGIDNVYYGNIPEPPSHLVFIVEASLAWAGFSKWRSFGR